MPGFLRRRVDRKIYHAFEKLAGCRFDVIWNFENSRFYDFRFAPPTVFKIYHQVDLNQDFHPQLAAKTADICFCTTDLILSEIKIFNEHSFKIHHGVSPDAFAGKDYLPAQTENDTKNITALYIGNLDMPYIDIDVVENLVKTFSRVNFFFVGPYLEEKPFFKRMQQYENCFLKGRVKSEELKQYTTQSDIQLVFYKEEYQDDQASPHKMMEYMASGKVIVATYTDEYKNSDLLLMSKINEEIPSLFEYAMTNLSLLNSDEQRQKRIAFAGEHTYDKQLDKIECYIKQVQKL